MSLNKEDQEKVINILTFHIAKLELKPTDILIVKCVNNDNPITERDLLYFSNLLKELIPDNKFLFVNNDLELQVIELKDLNIRDNKLILEENK